MIADVGMVYLTDTPEFVAMQSATTGRWTAPELMDPNAPRQTPAGPECTTRSDVFSFAMTVVEVRISHDSALFRTHPKLLTILDIFGKPPIQGQSERHISYLSHRERRAS